MRTVRFLSVVALAALAAAALPTQASAQGATLALVYEVSVAPGHGPAFEAAITRINQARAAAGDPWTWNTYQVQFGESFGNYIVRSPSHTWAELDAYFASEVNGQMQPQVIATLTPLITSARSWITATDQDLSHLATNANEQMVFNVAEFDLDPAGAAGFDAAMAAYKEAVVATNARYRWSFQRAAAGGDAFTVTLVAQGTSFADFEQTNTEVLEMMVEHHGEAAAQAAFDGFVAAIESSDTRIVVRRPDLSYAGN